MLPLSQVDVLRSIGYQSIKFVRNSAVDRLAALHSYASTACNDSFFGFSLNEFRLSHSPGQCVALVILVTQPCPTVMSKISRQLG